MLGTLFTTGEPHRGCQSLGINALKYLMDQLEERILQIDQLKNASKHLQHRDPGKEQIASRDRFL